ncbi:rho GTPase-activating protein 20-like [Corticium candelabrum]|uniref:rho GTPase-activating protein 20-like n=1 Tax=Corticium candelabrum TaxID=121492 RepID=UPI002E25A238|nr:rho GTPase-activating protein 20-like [Corticium candelabrum]
MNLNDGTVRLRRPSDHRTSATFQMDAPDEGRPPSSHEEATRARDSTPDSRFTIVEDLLTSEVVYYDRLKTVFHTYANPLSKWGLTGTDHDMLFGGVDELLRLVESFIRQLDESVQNWDASMVSVGGILNGLGSFWHAYELYCGSQRQLLRRLKDREKNTAFKAFLDVRRESSPNRLSLEALLTLPVQRVSEYHHLLGQLFDTMEHDHPDFDHLSDAVAKANQLVQRRQEEAIFLENQIKLAQVQERFSQNLYLNLPLDCVDSDGRKKKSSLPGHRYGSHGSGGNRIRNGGVRGVSHNTSPGLALRAWKGGPIRTTIRSYVKEGVVQFRTGYSHQDRYLVLFTDLLLVAKAKSQSTFRLKQRLRVSEMWLADCIEEVFETSQKEELSFVLGWPTTNTVATFGSKEDRDAWYVQLSRYINKQRDMVEPRSVSLKVYNRAGDTVNNPQFQIVNVDRNDTAQEVVSLALETVGLKDDPKGYQLWVISGKEESAYPLIGHEYPYAIKLHHVRHTLDSVENDQLRHVSKRGQCQFILKKRKKAQTSTTQQSLTPRRFLYKSIRKAPFVQWATKRRTGTPHGSQERLDCLQLFGVSLSKVTKDGVLPKSILDILVRLYKEGPSVPGVFRRSCNARLARKLKESLNNGEDVSIGDADILVLATVMKEFLRSLPDCIFCCENFADLVATNQNTEDLNRVDGILRVMDRLPLCNYIVLRHFMWVLYRVAENSEHNSMDAHNIAILHCVCRRVSCGE